MKDFYQGQVLLYKGMQGTVNFIDSEYITLCVNSYDKSEDDQEFALHKKETCCIVIYPNQWSELRFSTDQQEIAEIVENLK